MRRAAGRARVYRLVRKTGPTHSLASVEWLMRSSSCREAAKRSYSPPAFSLYRIFEQKSDTRNRTKGASSWAIKSLPDLSFIVHYSSLSPSNRTQQPRSTSVCPHTRTALMPVEVHPPVICHYEQLISPCNPSLAVDDRRTPAALFHEDREELCQQRHRCHSKFIQIGVILFLSPFSTTCLFDGGNERERQRKSNPNKIMIRYITIRSLSRTYTFDTNPIRKSFVVVFSLLLVVSFHSS